jgi:hypothetical protein
LLRCQISILDNLPRIYRAHFKANLRSCGASSWPRVRTATVGSPVRTASSELRAMLSSESVLATKTACAGDRAYQWRTILRLNPARHQDSPTSCVLLWSYPHVTVPLVPRLPIVLSSIQCDQFSSKALYYLIIYAFSKTQSDLFAISLCGRSGNTPPGC